jgi:hypothetical protein
MCMYTTNEKMNLLIFDIITNTLKMTDKKVMFQTDDLKEKTIVECSNDELNSLIDLTNLWDEWEKEVDKIIEHIEKERKSTNDPLIKQKMADFLREIIIKFSEAESLDSYDDIEIALSKYCDTTNLIEIIKKIKKLSNTDEEKST